MTLPTNAIRGKAQDKKKISIKYIPESLFDEVVIRPPMRVSKMTREKKVMLTVIWEITGFHIVDLMQHGACQQ
jgi:hypothetical protein